MLTNRITQYRSAGALKRWIPSSLRRFGLHMLGHRRMELARWRAEREAILAAARRAPIRTDLPPVAIVADIMQRHAWYEAACLELGLPYQVVDILASDWQAQIAPFGCFLVRPFVLQRELKAVYDDRVEIMVRELGKTVFPSPFTLWLYESKHRTSDWLDAAGIPHPTTWVFYDRDAANRFIAEAEYPLVFKPDVGSEATGVEILRSRTEAARLVRRCFGRGIQSDYGRQQGSMLLQAFIPNAREWRMVRIGDSYFGHRKGRRGDFHSGSKVIEFDTPPRGLLDLTRRVTDAGKFNSMSLDVMETEAGEYQVIELHAYFGCNSPHVMAIDGVPGRYLYKAATDQYEFEPGDFNRNQSCNLRVETLIILS